MALVLSFVLKVKRTLEDCLGFDVLEFSWVFGHGRTVVDSISGVFLGVSAFGMAPAP